MTPMLRLLALAPIWLAACDLSATAADCPDNPAALGTERVLTIDPATTGPVGRKQHPVTLPLAPKELVLTFDDGPWPVTAGRVLAALKHECVRATFFMLGRNAAANPTLARRVLGEGHTVAHHTYSHRLLKNMPIERAEAEIDLGVAAVETAVYGEPGGTPRTPFFRFPGFAANPALLGLLKRRGMVVFGADVWPGDWNEMTPAYERELLLKRLTASAGGIVLLHDIQAKTAAMLPEFLRELKRREFRVVHIEPAKR